MVLVDACDFTYIEIKSDKVLFLYYLCNNVTECFKLAPLEKTFANTVMFVGWENNISGVTSQVSPGKHCGKNVITTSSHVMQKVYPVVETP